ncbi:MAG: NYN domain-containing protein [Candidatus Aminicenantes bacterium]|nr:NYN domain-containing protein [Candidatus Aminicenantes bacterium]
MAYLIDGNNLLGHIYAGYHRDPAHRSTLVRKLQAFQRQTRTRVILVFDGTAPEGFPRPDKEKFSVLFPPPGESADSLIVDYIESRTDRRRLFVVSSDREIRAIAREAGATAVRCDEFYREMKKALRESREAREMDKDEGAASALEVTLWTEAFARKKSS